MVNAGSAAMLLAIALAGCRTRAGAATSAPDACVDAVPSIELASMPPPAEPSADGDSLVDAEAVAPTRREAKTLTYRLTTGTKPPRDLPNAWVYVPAGFEPRQRALHVVVIFHGYSNCISSYVSEKGERCGPGTPKRTGYDIPAQGVKSGTRALLVVPQLAFDARSSDPGPLGEPNGLRAFLGELLERLAPEIGVHTLADVDRLGLLAASGGYMALFPALKQGGVDVRDVFMLDTLYYFDHPALDFVHDHIADFAAGASGGRRLSLIWCNGAGTEEASQYFADRVQTEMMRAGLESSMHVRSEPPRPTSVEDLRAPISILHSSLYHDDVTREDLWKMLAASGI